MTGRPHTVRVLLLLGILTVALAADTPGQQMVAPQWIWHAGDPTAKETTSPRYFRKSFSTGWPADEAVLDITASPGFTVWLNGSEVGSGHDGRRVFAFDVKERIRRGTNVLAVRVEGSATDPGLLVRLGYVPNGQSRAAVVSDGTWKSTSTAPAGWEQPGFRDETWRPVHVIGPYGPTRPWGELAWDSGGDGRFRVPPGFRVEPVVRSPDAADSYSLVNLTFDNRGRLLVSRENGPVYLCTEPGPDGVFGRVRPYCDQVRNCQGMCWVRDALLLVGDGPRGTGLYRVRETGADQRVGDATLLLSFAGSMGEHGPHAVLHGPDDCIYVVLGNGAWARPETLAANSPLTRWPTGLPGPDQGKPGSREDVLLPRLDDPYDQSRTLAPGGTIWRLDPDGKNPALVVAGLRNAYDAAFSPDGELFTFDSDMEWDEGLPWYRPVRLCHCPPGSDFLWRDGSANTPEYYLDSLPAVHVTGRGSPVGMEFYDHDAFPDGYRGALFMADWSLGVIYAAHLEPAGASFRARVERFCQGTPLNITDVAVGPDGALYFCTGGRGSQGGVYRIVYTKAAATTTTTAASRLTQPLAAWSRAGRPRTHERAAGRQTILEGLDSADAATRRKSCERLVRENKSGPVATLWRLLGDHDRFVQTAARVALQHVNAREWAPLLAAEPDDRRARQAIVALCKTDQATAYAGPILDRLGTVPAAAATDDLLEYLRTLQLALIHCPPDQSRFESLAAKCFPLFPHADERVSRELAVVLTHFARQGIRTSEVRPALFQALRRGRATRAQQIHYFFCLRLLPGGWLPEDKDAAVRWYDAMRDWQGGHSFRLFLENILRDAGTAFTSEDVSGLARSPVRYPFALAALLRTLPEDRLPTAVVLQAVHAANRGNEPIAADLRAGAAQALARSPDPRARTALRTVVDRDPTALDVAARRLARNPVSDDWPYLVRALRSPSPVVVHDVIEALGNLSSRPRPDDPQPFRALLAAASRLDGRERAPAVAVLRRWTGGKQFGAAEERLDEELPAWRTWFAQTFPNEPPLAEPGPGRAAVAGWFDDLRAFLEKDPAAQAGDARRGRVVFEKAQCARCHRFGTFGEAVGPDLTTVAKRFRRSEILESIVYPSKVISDQYRSTVLMTKKGVTINGLVVNQGATLSILQADGSRVSVERHEVAQQYASLVSVMPEGLLDQLTKGEIADLFAFLESSK